MQFPRPKLTDTMIAFAVAVAVVACFSVASAQHGGSGGSSSNATSSSRGGSGGGGDDGSSGGNRGGGGSTSGGGTASGGSGNGGSGGGNGGGNGVGGGDKGLASLKTRPLPVTDLSAYLNPGSDARNAAIALGKALFWDMQSGGDGQQACASCHFNAGADSRTKGQINPGAAGLWQGLGGGAAANYAPSANEYPLHQLANMSNRNSQVMTDSANITGSQGLHHTKFVDVFPGSPVDVGTVITQAAAPDVYGVADANDPALKVNTRRTTGKNAPSVINAVYNFRNFWDGRAQNVFNGVNPSGANDATAFVLAADPGSGQLLSAGAQPAHQIVRIANGALASQSVGPPNNPVEMSYDGRDFKKLGKKMLSLPPLGNQLVATDDSVLGAYSNQSLAAGIPGISISYEALIQQAFQPQWWNSNQLVNATGGFVVDAQGMVKSAPPTNTDEFTLTEFNFSLFWGIAIQLYESTLVANDSRFDRFMDGDRTALTAQEQRGMNIFTGKGHCADCHMGAELTDASVANQSFARVGGAGNPVAGFHMIGVRPAAEDKIIAGGAAKTPGLRNVELTPPYFHNGGQLTLEQVAMFYSRGGDFGTRGVDQDQEVEPRGFSADDVQSLVAFLKSLTDPRVANQSAPFDHPSLDVPNGAVGNNFVVTQDGTGNAMDDPDSMLHLQASGRNGTTPLPTFTAGLQGLPVNLIPGPSGGDNNTASGPAGPATTPDNGSHNSGGGGGTPSPFPGVTNAPTTPVASGHTTPLIPAAPIPPIGVTASAFLPPAAAPIVPGLPNLVTAGDPAAQAGATAGFTPQAPAAVNLTGDTTTASTNLLTVPAIPAASVATDLGSNTASAADPSATTDAVPADTTSSVEDTPLSDDVENDGDSSRTDARAGTEAKTAGAENQVTASRPPSAATAPASTVPGSSTNPSTSVRSGGSKTTSGPGVTAPAATTSAPAGGTLK